MSIMNFPHHGVLGVLKEAIHVFLNIRILALSSCGDWNFPVYLAMLPVLHNMHMKIKVYSYKLFCPPSMLFALPVKATFNRSTLTLPFISQNIHITYALRFIVIFTWDVSPPRLPDS